MNKHKLIIILLILFVFVSSLSFVSAEGNGTQEDNVIEVDDYDGLYRAAQASNVINITSDIVRDENCSDILVYYDDVTINGNGHTINANNLGRLFVVYFESSLTINNLKFINGNALVEEEFGTFNGGCILNFGNLTIRDCTFTNNVAFDGGAIAADFNAYTLITGTNVFKNNKAHNDAGAIRNTGGSVLNITGKNTFDGNTATVNNLGKGGAILNVFDNSKLYIDGENIFNNNQAIYDAGAIFNHQATAYVTGKNTFTNNKASGNDGKGGAINNENATFFLSGDNLFKSNSAIRGGAIDNSLFDSQFTITGKNQFIENTALMGAALANQEAIKLVLDGENIFTSNVATSIGGAIYAYKGLLSLSSKNTFTRNSAVNTGGAIYAADCEFFVNGVNKFISNSAVEGGALLLYTSRGMSIAGDNTFDSNTASSAGGAIKAIDIANLILGNHNYFTSNNAGHSGGAIYVQGSTLDTKGALYEGNSALYGGAIYLYQTSFAANYNIFKNNRATYTGADVESFSSSIHSLEYNYWNSQNKVSQNNIHSYDVSNIHTWAVIDFTIPSQITQDSDTEVVRFKTNSFTNLNGEMPNYVVSATPNFNPSNVVISNNVGISKYTGSPGQVTVTVSSSNFGGSKVVNVIENTVKTSLNGNNIVLDSPGQVANYEVVLSDVNGKKLSGKTIVITVDGTEYNRTTDNQGKANLTLYRLENGYHEVVSKYAGEKKYYGSTTTNGIICAFSDQSNVNLIGNDIEMYYKDGTRYEVTLYGPNRNPMASQDIKIYINGGIYTRTTDDNGKASIAINLNAGNYSVIACYPGDDNLYFTFVNNTINIKSTISGDDIVKYFRNGTQYYAKFLDSQGNPLKKSSIYYNINGVFYTRSTDDEGVARMNINLNPGVYIITATNSKNNEVHSNKITVLSTLEADDLTKYYKNDSQYVIKVINGNGTPVGAGVKVKLNINGVLYEKVTNESGYARMNINLNPGTYIITAEYNGLLHSNFIKVLPTLYGKDIRMKFRDGTKYEVNLVDKQGNPISNVNVTLNINGVFYNRTTDDNGVARLNLNLVSGVYIITSTYGDAITSNKITISS